MPSAVLYQQDIPGTQKRIYLLCATHLKSLGGAGLLTQIKYEYFTQSHQEAFSPWIITTLLCKQQAG